MHSVSAHLAVTGVGDQTPLSMMKKGKLESEGEVVFRDQMENMKTGPWVTARHKNKPGRGDHSWGESGTR